MVIKRAALGVHDDLKKKKKKKTWFDYLLSDDYMFAPLLSSSHNNFSPSTSSLIAAGIDEESSSSKVKEQDFVEKVGDYLKSDCYLYSPLVISQPWLYSSTAHAAPTQTGLVGLLEKKDRSKSDEDLLKEATDKITTEKPPAEKIAISSVNNKEHDRSTVMKRVQRQTVKHIRSFSKTASFASLYR